MNAALIRLGWALVATYSLCPISAVGQKLSDTTVLVSPPAVHAGVGLLRAEAVYDGLASPSRQPYRAIAGVAVGADGSVVVADRALLAVHKYDASGRFVSEIGSPGNGPQNFGEPRDVAVALDGRILVYDAGGRLTVHSSSGAFLSSLTLRSPYRAPAVIGRPWARSLFVSASGDIYARLDFSPNAYIRSATRVEAPSSWVRLNSTLLIIDTIWEPRIEAEPSHVFVGTAREPQRTRKIPYSADFIWTVDRNGQMVTGWSDDHAGYYAIDILLQQERQVPNTVRPGGARPTRGPVRRILVPYRTVDVSQQERQDWQTAFTAYFRELDPAWNWSGPNIPVKKAPYEKLWSDADSRIWVGLQTESMLADGATLRGIDRTNVNWPRQKWSLVQVFHVIDRERGLIGSVRSPDTIFPQYASGDFLWAIVQTQEPTPTGTVAASRVVKKYRIVWNDPSQ